MDDLLNAINNKAVLFMDSNVSKDDIYQIIVDEVVHMSNAEFGSISIFDGEIFSEAYISTALFKNYLLKKDTGLYNCIKKKIPLVHYNVHKDHKTLNDKIKSIVYIPLLYNGEVIGVLSLCMKKKLKLTPQLSVTLQLIGHLSTLAIKKVWINAEAEKIYEVRNFFLELVGHQLKTPLTTINGYIELLHQSIHNNQNERLHSWIKRLSIESKKLTKMIIQIIEANKIKAGILKYHLQRYPFSQLVTETLIDIKKQYPQRRISFKDTSVDSMMTLDARKIKQVIYSIIDNALKFSPKDKKVEINLRSFKHFVRLEVTDYGIGIEKSDLPYIFEGFYNPCFSEEPGFILSLYMAKNIIHYHKGDITIFSKKGKSTKVQIDLPISKDN